MHVTATNVAICRLKRFFSQDNEAASFLPKARSDIIMFGREMQLSLFHMVFACIEIPRILLIKGKLHWRAKNHITAELRANQVNWQPRGNLQFSNITRCLNFANISAAPAKTDFSQFSLPLLKKKLI